MVVIPQAIPYIDAFLKQYKDPENEETLKSLNKLCVRIVFCLYAEDASVFGRKSMFHDYMQQFDAAHARKGLRDLFRVLNQKPEDRDPYHADDDPMLAAFPYVNGGLFDGDDIEIPPFTDEIMDLLLREASDDFDWSEISPTIFGAVFEPGDPAFRWYALHVNREHSQSHRPALP